MTTRPEVRWDGSYLAVVLSDRADVPVMHAWLADSWRPPWDTAVAACGRRRKFRDSGGPPFILPVRHARLWCRPCLACERKVGCAP
jgi:hypothetical protein